MYLHKGGRNLETPIKDVRDFLREEIKKREDMVSFYKEEINRHLNTARPLSLLYDDYVSENIYRETIPTLKAEVTLNNKVIQVLTSILSKI